MGDADKIEISERNLHIAVRELKERHPEVLAGVDFARHTLHPYSPDISEALSALRVGDIGYSDSPWFKIVGMRDKDRRACVEHMETSCSREHSALLVLVPEFDALMRRLGSKEEV